MAQAPFLKLWLHSQRPSRQPPALGDVRLDQLATTLYIAPEDLKLIASLPVYMDSEETVVLGGPGDMNHRTGRKAHRGQMIVPGSQNH